MTKLSVARDIGSSLKGDTDKARYLSQGSLGTRGLLGLR